MNEPVRTSANNWAATAQDAINGIRAKGATNLVLVPGAYWSGAHSWTKVQPNGQSNGLALTSFNDPADNFAFDIHQYFDYNSSGSSPVCVTPEKAEARLATATAWLRANGQRAMLTEFGVSRDPACRVVLETALRHMATNPEWLGWTAWASSAWFGSYIFNLYPLQSPPPPQLQTLQAFTAQ
jgi:endoglucanase